MAIVMSKSDHLKAASYHRLQLKTARGWHLKNISFSDMTEFHRKAYEHHRYMARKTADVLTVADTFAHLYQR